jgi:hypothetical protein
MRLELIRPQHDYAVYSPQRVGRPSVPPHPARCTVIEVGVEGEHWDHGTLHESKGCDFVRVVYSNGHEATVPSSFVLRPWVHQEECVRLAKEKRHTPPKCPRCVELGVAE